ncbi:DNA glycosylase, partial [Fistulina hepatica ATCC 64428]
PVKRKKPVKVIQPKHDPSAAPPNWEAVYNAIKAMRTKIEAPVDTKGCDMAQLLETDPRNKRFITLVSLILSVRTTDNICDATVKNLRQAVGGTMSLEKFLATNEDTIQEVLKSVGLNKADNLINTAHILREDFNSDVPDTIQDLVKLWGVGPKVGFLTLSVAWGKHDGIGVDVHVRRITQRLGWHNEEDPEKARQKLQVWFPKERFQELNKLLVGLGQTICGESPKCHLCALSSGICPEA